MTLTLLLTGPSLAASTTSPTPSSMKGAEHPRRGNLAVPTISTATSPKPAADVAQRYASRERSAKPLQDFRGGEGTSVYIGGGALTVVLLIVLLVVLL